MKHHEQVARIKKKLVLAKSTDNNLEVFGASSHRYKIGSPVQEELVASFENEYSIELPSCYRAFITGVGDGGGSYSESAAGPFYGIFPFRRAIDELSSVSKSALQSPPAIYPRMPHHEWKSLVDAFISNEDNVEDDIYTGILTIGSQGCSFYHGLVLAGVHRGRVVNIDHEYDEPVFAFESNFLDWYERWLDEIISGLVAPRSGVMFGFTMGGDENHLMEVFDHADDPIDRLDALIGLGRLVKVDDATCHRLLNLCRSDVTEIRHQALHLLTKFAYPLAIESLRAHLTGNDRDFLSACNSIHKHALAKASYWVEPLKARLQGIEGAESLRLVSSLLIESGTDFSEEISPFLLDADMEIRTIAFYSLGKLRNKAEKVRLFVLGLNDAAPKVVHATVQALAGVKDPALLGVYRTLLVRFKTDQHSILININHRLKEFGYTSIEDFKSDHPD